jgi:hypothetical protein
MNCKCGKHTVTKKRSAIQALRPRINALHSRAHCLVVEHGKPDFSADRWVRTLCPVRVIQL